MKAKEHSREVKEKVVERLKAEIGNYSLPQVLDISQNPI